MMSSGEDVASVAGLHQRNAIIVQAAGDLTWRIGINKISYAGHTIFFLDSGDRKSHLHKRV